MASYGLLDANVLKLDDGPQVREKFAVGLPYGDLVSDCVLDVDNVDDCLGAAQNSIAQKRPARTVG